MLYASKSNKAVSAPDVRVVRTDISLACIMLFYSLVFKGIGKVSNPALFDPFQTRDELFIMSANPLGPLDHASLALGSSTPSIPVLQSVCSLSWFSLFTILNAFIGLASLPDRSSRG